MVKQLYDSCTGESYCFAEVLLGCRPFFGGEDLTGATTLVAPPKEW